MLAEEFVRLTAIEAYYPVLLGRLLADVGRFSYYYMPAAEYDRLRDLQERMRVYWFEILERAHCNALLALLRLHRWLEGMCVAAESENLLAFAASFRGLLESAADSRHSLGDVPKALAAAFSYAFQAVHGHAESLVLAPYLENDLIHFSHGRKLAKNEDAPEAHAAKTMKEYLAALQGASSGPLFDGYAELCNITHPAADSVLYLLAKDPDGQIVFAKRADQEGIHDFCTRAGTVVTYCVSESILYPAVTLRILNRFDLTELRTPVGRAYFVGTCTALDAHRERLETATMNKRTSPNNTLHRTEACVARSGR